MQSGIEDIRCKTIPPTRTLPSMMDDIRQSLLDKPRSLSPKYFYDARGSDLFSQICKTPEYYPTRTEDALLKQYSKAIIEQARPEILIELGSGNSIKTRHLFNACEHANHICEYWPLDVCREIMIESSDMLSKEFDWLQVSPMLCDFHAGLGNLPKTDGRCLYVFLGGSIGNFNPEQTREFMAEIYRNSKDGDFFLLGADRIKSHSVLNAAYNDAKGITAEFNLNVLHVLNRELDADFNVNDFEHQADFNEKLNRIEMHLVSSRDQKVDLESLNESIEFVQGEKILTEISCKYSYEMLETLLTNAGFQIQNHFEPNNQYFSLVLATK